MSSKRLNFSVLERNVLLHLLEEHIDVVESKNNDGLTVRRKDETWAKIVSRFNAEPSVVKRTPRQLRKCWTNLKMRAKKSNSLLNLPAFAMRAKPSSRNHGNVQESQSMAKDSETEIKDEPVSLPFPGGAESAGSDRCVLFHAVESWSDIEEEPGYSGPRSDGEPGDAGSYQRGQESEERGEALQHAGEKEFRHETVVGSANSQWTDMDYARNEHEAKMALLTIQMETAHEQRELAREMREQTRQRHRLEMQVLDEKRRYRRMKMTTSTLPPHGQS